VPERPNGAVLKTADGATRPWVQIPPPPPTAKRSRHNDEGFGTHGNADSATASGGVRRRRNDTNNAKASIRPGLAQRGTAALLAAFDGGDADLVLIGRRPAGERFAWHPLVTEPLLLAVPPHHRLAGRRSVKLEEVADEPFVALQRGDALRALTDELCRAAGFEPRIAFEGDEVGTLRGLVAAGLGVALVSPQRVAAEEVTTATPHLRVRDEGAERELGMVWDPQRLQTPVVSGFRRFVVRHGRRLAAA
jgi:LysR family transcriptional activator of glutamate synthase operon